MAESKRKWLVQLWLGCNMDGNADCVPGAINGNGYDAWQKSMLLRNSAVCNTMNGPGGHYVKWDKSDR